MNIINILLGEVAIGNNKPVLSNSDIMIVFDGDSLTEGINNAGIDQYYPKEIQTWLSTRTNSVEFYSYGVSGQSTQDMIADASTQIDTKVDASKINVIVAWEDVNAILNDGRTASQNFDDMETYFSGRKTAGYNYGILIGGYYPRIRINGTYNNSAWDTGSPSPLDNQHDYFELLSNASGQSWDVLVDLRNNAIIGGARAQQLSDNTYFNDSVHLQNVGYDQVVNDVIQNGLLSIFQL